MEPDPWTIDWNPDFADDLPMRRAVLRALDDERVASTVVSLAQQAMEEALDDGLETEHLVWLESPTKFALFIRVWFEASEEKVFVIVEENDLGDIGFLVLHGFECATYEGDDKLRVEFRDPETLGVEP